MTSAKKMTRRSGGYYPYKQQAQRDRCACCLSWVVFLLVSSPESICLAAHTHLGDTKTTANFRQNDPDGFSPSILRFDPCKAGVLHRN